ncbi:MAG: A24 family peptidase [Acidobacteriota bacterium]
MTPFQTAALAALVTIAGVWDWRARRIPNWLTVAGLVAGLAANSPLSAAKGFAIALLVYVPLYILRAVGGGDLKLMAAIGVITGPEVWLVLFVIQAVLGGIVALGLVIAKGRLRQTFSNIGHILRSAPRTEAPYKRRPELDIAGEGAITMPRGTVIMVSTLFYLAGQAL